MTSTAVRRLTDRRLSRSVGLALVIGLIGQSCTSVTEADLELTRFDSLRVERVTRDDFRLTFEMEIHNRRNQRVSFRDLRFQFALRNGSIGTGSLDGRYDISAHGQLRLVAAVVVPFREVKVADFNALFEAIVPYQIEGQATLLAPIEGLKIDIALKGVLPLSDRIDVLIELDDAAAHLGPPKLKTNLTGLLTQNGEIEIDLRNPFPFALPITRIDYRIFLADRTIARGDVARGLRLEPGVRRLSLPIEGQPVEALSGLLSSLLNPRRAQLAVAATVVIQHGERTLSLHLGSGLSSQASAAEVVH